MSKTELEEDLRSTFERAAASVPSAPDLAARATTGARQAQRRTWIASGAAAAAVAVVAVVGFSLPGGPPGSPPAGAPAPPPARPRRERLAPTITTVVRQLAAGAAGRLHHPEGGPPGRPDPRPSAADGTWTGSDGCNGYQRHLHDRPARRVHQPGRTASGWSAATTCRTPAFSPRRQADHGQPDDAAVLRRRRA